MKNFMHEFNLVKENFPVLKFKFPSEARLKEIYRINYITKDEKSKSEYFDSISAAKILIKLDQRYLPEDLKKKLRERLKGSK